MKAMRGTGTGTRNIERSVLSVYLEGRFGDNCKATEAQILVPQPKGCVMFQQK